MHPFRLPRLIKPMLAAGVCAWAMGTWAQGAEVTPATPGSHLKTASAAPSTPGTSARPHWSDLSPSEQQALAPLKPQWQSISVAQKRKWLAMAKNFANLPPEEQNKLHARVQEWALLSPQQRAQARLNFGESAQHSVDHKRAKWEAYQALSDEQPRKLADDILLAPPRGAALASRPVAPSKLTQAPAPKPDQVLQPRIDTDQVHPKTLLPQSSSGTSTR
jgi:hypothetical protein